MAAFLFFYLLEGRPLGYTDEWADGRENENIDLRGVNERKIYHIQIDEHRSSFSL